MTDDDAFPRPTLASLREGYQAVVVGASGGLGGAFVSLLADDPRCRRVHALSRRPTANGPDGRITSGGIDITDPASVAAACEGLEAPEGVDLVIVATGLLAAPGVNPEKSWRQIDADAFAQVMAVNALGPALVARTLLDRLPRDRKAVFAALSARVGSIGDNRLGGWHSYRASKAALNMLIRNFAVELARSRPQAVALALHPGTVDTGLSRPFQAGVPGDRLFTPAFSAGRLLAVIEAATPARSGACIAWDGETVPP